MFRKIVFWTHLTLGVSAGGVILFLSITGVILTYERQITSWSDARYVLERPDTLTGPVPWSDIIEAATATANEGSPSSLVVWSDQQRPVTMTFGRRHVFVDRSSARVLGERSARIESFFGTVRGLHRWFNVSNYRGYARLITGFCTLVLAGMILSGLFLWLPRRFTKEQMSIRIWFRRGRGNARDFNWHHVLGIWTALPLLIIAVSGTIISYDSAAALFRYAFGSDSVPVSDPVINVGSAIAPFGFDTGAIEVLMDTARGQLTHWETITMRFPSPSSQFVQFVIDQGNGGQPHKRYELSVDKTTGAIITWTPPRNREWRARFQSWMRWAHTGEVYGVWSQTIAGVATGAAVVLGYTGLALAWRRFNRVRSGKPSAKRGTPSNEPSAPEVLPKS